jgi:hypothetical protein
MGAMNAAALFAVLLFASALLLIFGSLYMGALASHRRGELGADGLRLLRLALLGHLTLYALLAVTAFLTG